MDNELILQTNISCVTIKLYRCNCLYINFLHGIYYVFLFFFVIDLFVALCSFDNDIGDSWDFAQVFY